MRLLVLAALLALIPQTAALAGSPGQLPRSASADIRGTVYDPMRAPIAGARIVVSSAAGVPAASTVTDERGSFAVPLAPGLYRVTVNAPGFREGAATVHLASTTVTADVVLAIAALEEAVTVTAPATYQSPTTRTAMKTATPLLNVPQSVTVVTRALIQDQMMASVGDGGIL